MDLLLVPQTTKIAEPNASRRYRTCDYTVWFKLKTISKDES